MLTYVELAAALVRVLEAEPVRLALSEFRSERAQGDAVASRRSLLAQRGSELAGSPTAPRRPHVEVLRELL